MSRNKNRGLSKGPSNVGSSTGEGGIRRDNIGRFASQGKPGKEKVPTIFSGPARASEGEKVRITSILEKPLSALSHVDSERIIIPSGLEKAYSSYQKVKSEGVRIELKELVIDLENLLEDIVFQPSESEEEWCVEWCTEVGMATGNSARVAMAIHEALEYTIDEEEDFSEDKDNPVSMGVGFGCIEGWANSIITLKFLGPVGETRVCGNIFISPEGENWIIDYTARQWDARATFPLVQPRELWEAWIKKHNYDKAFISSAIGA